MSEGFLLERVRVPAILNALDAMSQTNQLSAREDMENGVHYCQSTARYQVWIDGLVVAESNELADATTIVRDRLRRRNLIGFKPSERWMVEAYGD